MCQKMRGRGLRDRSYNGVLTTSIVFALLGNTNGAPRDQKSISMCSLHGGNCAKGWHVLCWEAACRLSLAPSAGTSRRATPRSAREATEEEHHEAIPHDHHCMYRAGAGTLERSHSRRPCAG